MPWEYFTFGQALTQAQVAEIRGASIKRDGVLHDGTRSGYKEGVEKQNHKLREYITAQNYQQYPEYDYIINEVSEDSYYEDLFGKDADHILEMRQFLSQYKLA